MHECISKPVPARGDAVWPPDGWERSRFKITRYNYAKGVARPVVHRVRPNRDINIVHTVAGIVHFRGTFDSGCPCRRRGAATLHHIAAPDSKGREDGGDVFKFVNDDFLVRNHPLVRSQGIQDTNLQLVVTHPGMVIERGVWRVFLFQAALAWGAIFAVIYFYTRLLKLIFVLSSHTRQLVQRGTDGDLLPYANRKDEIGILAGALNELIRRIRVHVERELFERTTRDAQEGARRAEAVRNSEASSAHFT